MRETMTYLWAALVLATVGCGSAATTPPPAPTAERASPAPVEGLLTPERLVEQAPATYRVYFETTKGAFTVEVTRSWAPLGADRFYNLVGSGFFTDIAFFRAIKGFMVQFGIHGDPKVTAAWHDAKILDDPVGSASNLPGYFTFAMAGRDTRTTQMFINYADNARLDQLGFPPIGKVIDGMEVVERLNTEYGEGAPRGIGPHQGRLRDEGNAYLKAEFPRLDYIVRASLL